MAEVDRRARILRLSAALPGASDAILAWIERVMEQMDRAHTYWRDPESDLITEKFLTDLGDTIRLHHCFSEEPFTKDKFEYAMDVIAKASGHTSALAPKTNPGHDITIGGSRFSLKTQADKGIKLEKLHISKFMELGKGEWTSDVRDFHGLRDQFLRHMKSYDRILDLRCIVQAGSVRQYELVEIPKNLLERAKNGRFEVSAKSKQVPPCGHCRVFDGDDLAFSLYFDGGSERKLQINHLDKNLCVVHADWRFSVLSEKP